MTTLLAPTIRDRALEALRVAGLTVYPFPCKEGEEGCARGRLDPGATVAALMADPRWQFQEIRSAYHAELGPDRVEFRSYRNELVPGSCQLVINPVSGVFYADIDLFNPSQDVAGAVGHGFGEVFPSELAKFGKRIGRWFKRLFGG